MAFGIGNFSIGESAIGVASDVKQRLQRWLPKKWFPTFSDGTVTWIDGILNGIASTFDTAYRQLSYTKMQARISTAIDGFLDLISWDFFGATLPRRAGEDDDSYRARILPNILRPRVVRQGIEVTLKTLTGRTAVLFEPIRVSDAGALDAPYLGFDMAGGLTDYSLFPYQMQLIAFLGNGALTTDIYAAVEASKPAGTVVWVAIQPNAVRFMDAANSSFIPCIGRF